MAGRRRVAESVDRRRVVAAADRLQAPETSPSARHRPAGNGSESVRSVAPVVDLGARPVASAGPDADCPCPADQAALGVAAAAWSPARFCLIETGYIALIPVGG